ncbi:MAG: DUF4340 domain-containing protein [Pseudomonadota bacterium]
MMDARRKTVFILAGIAAILLVFNLIGSMTGSTAQPANDRLGTRVLPDFETQRAQTQEIRIILADDAYTLRPGPSGWVMAEAGGYPIRSDRLAALASGLSDLEWGEARTRDSDKFDRIGLGDPDEGGTGARIEILGPDDTVSSLITGRKAGRLYGRLTDDATAFRLTGDLPPLYTRDAWLDFDLIDIDGDAIAALRIVDVRGEELFLRRPPGAGARAFRPAAPFSDRQLVNRIAAAGPALAISRFAPVGAKPASDISTRSVARHITTTYDGLDLDVSAYRDPDGLYVTVRAIEAGEGARRAETINARVEGWAFELAEFDWNDFTPLVSSIARPPAAPDPTPDN